MVFFTMSLLMSNMILLLSILISATTVGSFTYGAMTFGSLALRQPVHINITFTTSRALYAGEEIIVNMPGFTRQYSKGASLLSTLYIEYGVLIMSPSVSYIGAWHEGTNVVDRNTNTTHKPYLDSYFSFLNATGNIILAGQTVTLNIYKENGIGAYCGFPGSVEYNLTSLLDRGYETNRFRIGTNSTLNNTHAFDLYLGMGVGCKNQNYCNGNGLCDYCAEQCHCYDGYGSENDTVTVGRDLDGTCKRKVCPAGKAFVDIPTAYNKAHAMAECSNKGICNRGTGVCKCFSPFSGGACERLRCPNDCSGHGLCVSMAEIARQGSMTSPSFPVVYGAAKYQYEAWDYDAVYGCLCDSSWTVGYEDGQTQLSEYFGPDCSLRHCPSGDNPFTSNFEPDCQGISQIGGIQKGRVRNKCQIDCSDRGICDYSSGTCTCFTDSWGDDCSGVANSGGSTDYRTYPIEPSGNLTTTIIGN